MVRSTSNVCHGHGAWRAGKDDMYLALAFPELDPPPPIFPPGTAYRRLDGDPKSFMAPHHT